MRKDRSSSREGRNSLSEDDRGRVLHHPFCSLPPLCRYKPPPPILSLIKSIAFPFSPCSRGGWRTLFLHQAEGEILLLSLLIWFSRLFFEDLLPPLFFLEGHDSSLRDSFLSPPARSYTVKFFSEGLESWSPFPPQSPPPKNTKIPPPPPPVQEFADGDASSFLPPSPRGSLTRSISSLFVSEAEGSLR